MSREFLRSVAGRQFPGLGEVAVYWSDLDYTNIFDTKDFSFDDKPVPESNTFPELIEHNAEGTAIALLIALNACADQIRFGGASFEEKQAVLAAADAAIAKAKGANHA